MLEVKQVPGASGREGGRPPKALVDGSTSFRERLVHPEAVMVLSSMGKSRATS